MNRIFLDANAGVSVFPESLEAFVRASQDSPGNPASLHRTGRRAQGLLEDARDAIGEGLGVPSKEILFTSGATESNNLALLGAARAFSRLENRPMHIIGSFAEHASVFSALRLLQQEGHSLHLLPIRPSGHIVFDEGLNEQQQPDLVAFQWANNETGAVQNLSACLSSFPSQTWIHVDAAQGIGKLSFDQQIAEASSFSLSGHKFGAPKGVGILRLAEGCLPDPIFAGGGHQNQMRPGTENPALAHAFAVALELAQKKQAEMEKVWLRCQELFLSELTDFPNIQRNGCSENTLPNTIHLSFPHIKGKQLLPACDVAGLECSSGSACHSGAATPSPVLLAAGFSEELARASLRISFDWNITEAIAKEGGERFNAVLNQLYNVANK